MTKSGIGTSSGDTNTSNVPPVSTNPNGTSSSSQNGVDQAEIPIWVADKKKWVTGISKKTTVNDLIHAILKQCQIPLNEMQSSSSSGQQYVLVEFETTSSLNESNNNNNSNESQQHQVISSQKIIDGDSKVIIL